MYLTLTLWMGGSVILMTLLFDGIVHVHSKLQVNYYPDSVVQSFYCMLATWFQYFNDMSDSSVQWANETRNTETTV